MLLLTTYYNKVLYYNKLGVGSNLLFCCNYLATLLFCLKNHAAQVYFLSFLVIFCQKSKKICQFFAIFSLCVSMIYEKFEKKVCQNS